jgi:hypothetical protein
MAQYDTPRRCVTDRILFVAPIADRFLAIGRADEAERVVYHHIVRLIRDAREGHIVPRHVAQVAADEALKLAMLSKDPRWVELTLDLHTASRGVMSDAVVTSLEMALRSVPGVDRERLHCYLVTLRERRNDLERRELEIHNRLERINAAFHRLKPPVAAICPETRHVATR